jgi:hypothetical protein
MSDSKWVPCDRQWHVAIEPQCISVSTSMPEHGYGRPSVASASWTGKEWWVNRVKVDRNDERKGIGRTLVGMLLTSIIENHKEGPLVVQVIPGGTYGTPIEKQKAFYLACGFEHVSGEGTGIVLEWRPRRDRNVEISESSPVF